MKNMILKNNVLEEAMIKYYQKKHPDYSVTCSFRQYSYKTTDSDGFEVTTHPIVCDVQLSKKINIFGKTHDLEEKIHLEGNGLENVIKDMVDTYFEENQLDLSLSTIWTVTDGFKVMLNEKTNDKRKVLR